MQRRPQPGHAEAGVLVAEAAVEPDLPDVYSWLSNGRLREGEARVFYSRRVSVGVSRRLRGGAIALVRGN